MKKANIGLALLLALVTLAGCDQQGVTSAGSSSESSTGTSSSAGDSGSSSTPVVETHSILIGETGGATVTPSKESAEAGERITLTIVCPDGKEVDKVTLSVVEVEVTENPDGTYSFLMPAGDVTVTVTLKDEVLSSYVLTIDNKAGVEIVDLMDKGWNTIPANADGTYDLKPNETYTLLIKPGSGTGAYRVRIGDTVIQANEGSYSFTMPASDATITIETIPSYKVTLDYDADAISEVYLMDSAAMTELNASSIIEGTNVYVSPTAKPGYAVTGILLDGEALELEGTSAFFTMPAKDVTITIETEGQAPAGHAIEIQEPDGISISIGSEIVENETYFGTQRELVPYPFDQTTWEAGETIYVQAEVMGSYTKILTLEKVTWNGNEIALDEDGFGSFVMPEEGVVLTAETEWIYYNLSFDGGDTGITATFANEEGTTAVAHQGETITVTLDVPEGVTVDQVLVNDTPAEDKYIGWTESEEEPYVYTFTMPYQDIAISVEASVPTTGHALSYKIEGSTDPTLSATFYNESQEEITTAKAGETVYISVSRAPLGYKIVGVYLGDTALGTTLVDGWTRYVIEEMPDEDVQIRIVYAQAVTVTINLGADAPAGATCAIQDSSWQTIEGSSFLAVPGEVYYLDIYADNIWPVRVLANGVEVPLDDNTGKYKLTVPSENTTITVEWPGAGDSYSITYKPGENDPDGLNYYLYVNWVATNQANEGDEVQFMITGGVLDSSEISRVLVNGEEATHEYGLTWSFTMPAEDVEITIEWASDASTYALTYDFVGTEDGKAWFYTQNPGGWMDQLPLSGLGAIAAGEKIYIDVYENGTWAAPTSVTLNGNPVTETYFDGSITYYVIEMPEQDSHLVFTWEGGEEEPPVTTTQNLIYEPAESDHGAEVMFFPGTGPDAGSITTAKAGDTVLVYVWCETATPSQVLVNGEPATPSGDYDSTWEFVMPDEGDAKITLVWEEPAQSNLVWVPEEDAPEGAEVKFYDADDTSTEITYSNPGEIVYIEITGGLPSGGASGVKVNGEAVYVFEMAGYYAFEMPEGTATVTIDWFNY